MDDATLQYVQIITQAGLARSNYIEAIHKAASGAFEQAEELMLEGNGQFLEGHKIHTGLIQKEAAGEPVTVSLLLIHTEDQLLAAEQFKILARELIEANRRIVTLERGVKS